MKRFIILITTLFLMCTLVSCGRSTSNQATEPSQPTTQEPDATSDDTTIQPKEDDELMNKTLNEKEVIKIEELGSIVINDRIICEIVRKLNLNKLKLKLLII